MPLDKLYCTFCQVEHFQHQDKAVPDMRGEITELRDIMDKTIQRSTELKDQLNNLLQEGIQKVFNNETILGIV